MSKDDKLKHFEPYPDMGPQDDMQGGEVSADGDDD